VPTNELKTEPNRNPRRDSGRLSSVTTAIHLLKAFDLEDQELGITELAVRLNVAKSTVHRLAVALLDEGMLQQNAESGRYRLGFGLFALGSLVRSRFDVANASKETLNALRDETQENVRLAVLEGTQVLYLHDFESPQTLRLRCGTGQQKPAFCVAEGLCLLAGLRESELADVLADERIALTPNSVADEAALRARIQQVKHQGYAIEDEECEEGTCCLAAPIFQNDGRVLAAVGVAGPSLRMKKNEFAVLAPVVVEAAEAISRSLGFAGRPPVYA
jgi:DNA-binding IclR family transcriptional regulator